MSATAARPLTFPTAIPPVPRTASFLSPAGLVALWVAIAMTAQVGALAAAFVLGERHADTAAVFAVVDTMLARTARLDAQLQRATCQLGPTRADC